MSDSKKLSVRCELETIRQAVDGARMITDVVRHHHTLTEEDEQLGPQAVAGILCLISQRMELVEKVVSGGADPCLIAGAHNIVIPSEVDGNDLYIQKTCKPLPSS